jgi:uncharacterized protein (DUF1330 family)
LSGLDTLRYSIYSSIAGLRVGRRPAGNRGAVPCRLVEVTLCVLLWARDGRDADLGAYEDQVLGLLTEHGGQVIRRARTLAGTGAGEPTEVQLLQFPSEAALDAFMHDPRRGALAGPRDAAIARTDVLRVRLV